MGKQNNSSDEDDSFHLKQELEAHKQKLAGKDQEIQELQQQLQDRNELTSLHGVSIDITGHKLHEAEIWPGHDSQKHQKHWCLHAVQQAGTRTAGLRPWACHLPANH